MSFNLMAAVTIHSDFGAQKKIKSDTVSTVSPSISHEMVTLRHLSRVLPSLLTSELGVPPASVSSSPLDADTLLMGQRGKGVRMTLQMLDEKERL